MFSLSLNKTNTNTNTKPIAPRKYNKQRSHYIGFYCGECREEVWIDANKRLHRIAGPAHIKYHSDGTYKQRNWYVHGKGHRDDGGPASIYDGYSTDSDSDNEEGIEKIKEMSWIVNGNSYRLKGPSFMSLESHGKLGEFWDDCGGKERTIRYKYGKITYFKETTEKERQQEEEGYTSEHKAFITSLPPKPIFNYLPAYFN